MDRMTTALDLTRVHRDLHREGPANGLEATARAVSTDEAVRRSTRVAPVLSTTLERARLLRPGAIGPVGPAYKMLRTQVLQRLEQLGANTLAIVSPRSGDGKTTTAINLAISLACDPTHTALLVDLDLRKPGVGSRFGFEFDAGVEDYLCSRVSLDQLMIRPEGYERLVVLPGKSAVEQSSELLLGMRARELAHELKTRYANRIVLYDLPPALEADDALAFIRNVDAALIVVREGKTSREDIMNTVELLRDTPIVGTVLNASREKIRTSYY